MRSTLFLTLLLLLTLDGLARAAEVDIPALLAHAKTGETVALPAGTFKIGGLRVPAGVRLQGAGYDRTIIDAGGQEYGFIIQDAPAVTVSDCTVQGATVAGVKVEGGGAITLANLRLLRNLCGINAAKVDGLRISNVVAAFDRNALVLHDIRQGSIVNCTVTGNTAIGMTLANCHKLAVFNNVMSGNDLGLYLAQHNTELAIDYNLWSDRIIGKIDGEYLRGTVSSWASLTGYDQHSVKLPVVYANPARDEYWPVSTIPWQPSHVVTAGWGAPSLAGVLAPRTDIRGCARGRELDAGAFATGRRNVGPADGRISISTDEGVKSAGVFRKDGTLLCYLFQGLPLRKGAYEFWLPARDYLSHPIAAGSYEVRVLESPVSCEHLGYVANKGADNDLLNANDMHVQEIAYADDGRVILCNGWQEKRILISDMDPATGKASWKMAGASDMDGLAIGERHLAYALRSGSGNLELVQLDTRTGEAQKWPDQDYKQYIHLKHVNNQNRLAYLHGQLFLTEAESNKVYYTSATMPTFGDAFSVPAPTSPAADAQNGLLWVISEGKTLLALNAKGEVQQRFAGVAKPVALAIRQGRLAVASADTGKVHVFDCANPAALQPLFTIGTGADPVGPMQPNRFEFKESKIGGVPCTNVELAVGPKGEIGVIHSTRVAMFDPAGKLVRDSWADFCWDMLPMNFGDGAPTGFYHERGASASFEIDAKTRSWRPQANWAFPADSEMLMFFSMGGQRYAMGRQKVKKFFPDGHDLDSWIICRLDGYTGVPIRQYLLDLKQQQWLVHDGVTDTRDTAAPWLDADRQPVKLRSPYLFSYCYPARDGSLNLVFQEGGAMGNVQWPALDGVTRATIARIEPDDKGLPRLMLHKEDVALLADHEMPSPFDTTKNDSISLLLGGNGTLRVPGGWVYMPAMLTSPAMIGNLVNGSGTDVIGTDAAGKLRWFRPLTQAGPIIGLCNMQGLVVVGGCGACEFYTMDTDGLATGNFALPWAAHYRFGLMDHPNVVQPFTGNDGQPYFLVGDFMSNSANWFALRHVAAIKKFTLPLRISDARAESLRAEPLQVAGAATGKPPTVLVRKLAAPLPIDGDLVKWRKAGITPQILITPDAGGFDVTGPADASAVVRVAYEGDNLYVQVIKFDDRVVMYQPADLFYKQDCIEMSINGYAVGGFKYNITRVRDLGDYIFRDRWFSTKLCKALDPQLAPRKIVVLDNAKDVEERHLIENLYGIDLSASPVIITEFKLPIAEVYNKDQVFNKDSGLPERPLEMKSGASFGLGFLIDDNDQPGSDEQKFIAWPSTYGTWAPVEAHAHAVLE